MPKQITEIKKFIQKVRGEGKGKVEPKSVKIKRNKDCTKIKLRCSRYLYTLVIKEKEKADKLISTLPATVTKKEIK
eukprot:CAMPEP_0115008708 /NCGR_PEP_ID=MMETSP0216-20121206/22108_1 /TAXON_ID=223996 /ORGANISM="Protocruzia adherens, Strain Boccale" /LENGTH=75 /DNA_ID=CAMNT_0002376237 /DNA_START=50 /DNA_END=277 /DNA_ORIENTATION=-